MGLDIVTLNHHDALFGRGCLLRSFVFPLAVDTLGSNVYTYVSGRAPYAEVDDGGMFFSTDCAGILSCWASLPLESVLLTFGTLVSSAGSEVGFSLVDFSNDQDRIFGQFVVEVLVREGDDN